MITNNYFKWQAAQEMFGNRNFDSTTGANMGVVDTTGAITPMLFKYANTFASYNFSLGSEGMTGGFNLVDCQFGSGTGAFDPDDYTLSDDITDHFGDLTYIFSYIVEDNVLKKEMRFFRRNTSNETVTIKQVGVLKVLKQNDTDSTWVKALIAEFNIEPITVPPGEEAMITVNWEDSESETKSENAMLLDQYYKWRGGIQAYSHQNGGSRDIGLVDPDAGSVYVYFNNTKNSSFNSYALDSAVGIRLGGEAGSISSSDYCLEDDITSELTLRGTSGYAYSTTGNKVTRHVRSMFYNGTGADVSIGQLGVTKRIIPSSSGTAKDVLIYKKNLENPIILKSGDSKTIMVEWSESST